MKGTIIALLATVSIATASAFAADKNDVPAPPDNPPGQPMMEMPQGRGPMPMPLPPLPPRKPLLFSATVATDNPAETINKLTALIPTGSAKHYEVRVEVVPVPDMP
ncbi:MULTISPECIES: hypothetical protein [Klebsiella]|uniref:Uncharacterized protein n=1 Tax=Klebsiella electrica TaxID=1259973 RepID=A0AAJ5QY97_9ENTR|nr:hypothetical protein [Klebsiella electrica]MXF49160.1 hypothetical protein [Raoultella sp. Lac2]MXF98985.1 hypothetical protein [Raoultella sp. Lac1]PJR65218.1 hypothetical protein CWM52_07810 [Raoultella sp. T31]WBW63369.1 hypothetical protein OR613_10955 [Klebsiella electrica]WIO41318.1 hypothetical protein P2G42_15370 [Klebsiella electrica]